MVNVLIKTNKTNPHPIDEKLLKDILTIVVSHPLESDRGMCQDKISFLISQHRDGRRRED
ncbi:MAG: hypothetical protein AUF79_01705 [Crenarchaeota archaeon 13_1_20CM_2_51_8]|nr:MAG: hypothetical protein AUF79_01705 [Crenarchaeota archaeon 13_1_20CM_2_51_8]